jgi:hypothetical protein
MSKQFSLSFTNKIPKNDKPGEAKDGKSAVGNETNNKGAKAKKNPLLNAKTDDYVDDSDLFKSRISRTDRLEYFMFLKDTKDRRILPRGFRSWMSDEIAIDQLIY